MEEKLFPIMHIWIPSLELRKMRHSAPFQGIPWRLMVLHENQALFNHMNQTIQRLADRGGLSPCEALAVLEDREFELLDTDDALDALEKIVHDYKRKRE